MTDLQELFHTVDQLSTDEFKQLYDYMTQRRRVLKWWIVPPENIEKIFEALRPMQEDAAKMTEEEVNAAIDAAIAEVRRERKVM